MSNLKVAVFGVNQLSKEMLLFLKDFLPEFVLLTISPKKAKSIGLNEYQSHSNLVPEEQIKYVTDYGLKSQEDIDYFNKKSFDLGLVIAWNRLLPESILATFKKDVVGFHGTPFGLPKGKGRSPLIWSIVLGYKSYHYYLLKLGAKADSGGIYEKRKVSIHPWDDSWSVYSKLAFVGAQMFKNYLNEVHMGTASPEPHPQGEESFFPKRGEKDGCINWNKTALEIYNLTRALTPPYPGAHTHLKDCKVIVYRSIPYLRRIGENYCPGEIVKVLSSNKFIVATGHEESLLVQKYQSDCAIKEGHVFE